jgi:exopolyphosphatase/guanosine-5'-triphosphate,3'-diphosphate pyrophosphatase
MTKDKDAMSDDTDSALEQVIALAERYDYEVEHSHQDARLALRIFDLTTGLHGLDDGHRDLLHYAAILHDIGYWHDYEDHHKHAFRMIVAADLPALTPREKLIVANVARYHRSTRPKLKHGGFAALEPEDREIVAQLGAILRFADGLDRGHADAVEDLDGTIYGDVAVFTLYPPEGNELERWAGRKKSRFFADTFGVTVMIR